MTREYYLAHKEEILAKRKIKYGQNKVSILASQKEYYQANKQGILQRQKEYTVKNYDKRKEAWAAYRAAHRAERTAYRSTEAYRVSKHKSDAKYVCTLKGKAARSRAGKVYSSSLKGKAVIKAYHAVYQLSPKYVEYTTAYRKSKGYKELIAKWRTSMSGKASRLKNYLKRAYSLTPAEYAGMLQQQGGGCAICGGTNPNGRRLYVDHDHETGQVRGLLCGNHNTALGLAKDNAYNLMLMIDYLTERG